MLACVDCKKEMRVLKNGVGLDYAHGHVYPSDIWICDSCGKKTANANTNPISDPKYKTHDEYIMMVKP